MNKTGCCLVQGDMIVKKDEEIGASLMRYKQEEWK